ncbi:hypothetical protein FFI94_013715 [Rhodococcus sp. KBS0724]|uniref:hypothetical protein n=1 Tax=Rhodococcus sp. KBS0724 TaxID=1179674 RepID=UPI00110DA64C|nr:hypothetical protein [Rhodococcus sp. KBS0724]TSD47110.1 hypothetical protein FFI94_013715 [Rhodococcus sp. KBS0724]
MTTSKVRLWTAASLTFVPTAALIVARLVWGDQLPPTVASHWSGSTPDGFATTTTFFAITLAVSLIASMVAAATAIRASDSAPLLLSVTATAAATSATIWILSVALTLDAGTPENARIGWWIALPIAAAMTGIGAWALTARDGATAQPPLPTPTLDSPLTATERAAWIGRVNSLWPWILSAGLTALTVGTAAYSDWWVAAILLAATVMTAAFASVTVRVDNSGLSISSWGVRWKKIAITRVKSASVDTIRPLEWGGYGYRITPRGTAVTLRSGEAIVLTLETGRVFAVTVDHPEDGVRLLNSLVQRTDAREI